MPRIVFIPENDTEVIDISQKWHVVFKLTPPPHNTSLGELELADPSIQFIIAKLTNTFFRSQRKCSISEYCTYIHFITSYDDTWIPDQLQWKRPWWPNGALRNQISSPRTKLILQKMLEPAQRKVRDPERSQKIPTSLWSPRKTWQMSIRTSSPLRRIIFSNGMW